MSDTENVNESTEEPLDIFDGLKPREILFVQYYCGEANSNGARAARMAGYSQNQGTSEQQAVRLLNRPDIQNAIRAWLKPRIISGERVLGLLANQGELDATDFESCFYDKIVRDEQGAIVVRRVDWNRVRELGLGKLVKSVKQSKFGESIEFVDVQRALELLGKYHSLFTDRVKIDTESDDMTRMSDDQLRALARGESPK